MTRMLSAENVVSISEWAERSEHWRAVDAGAITPRRLRDRNTKPLILCGHGVSLRIQNSSLVIRDGFTHYPQEQASHRFFRGDLSLPPRIVLIDGSGTLSFDVLTWLSEQGVALIRIDWSGNVASVLIAPRSSGRSIPVPTIDGAWLCRSI